MFFFAVITDEERAFLGGMIERIAEGDKQALAAVYNCAGGRLFSVALGLVRDRTFAEDVLQDSFLKIARSAHTYKAGTNGYAWLCTVVRTTALTALKAEGKKRCADIDDFYSLSESDDKIEKSENAALVERAFSVLSGRERLAVWLKYYNDMTVREIAEELGLGKSAAHELVKKAEEKMTAALKPT